MLTCQYAAGIQVKLLSGEITINYGAVYENAVAQELLCNGITPYYYNSKKQGELDFVIGYSSGIVPIEVKSGKDYERHNALSNVINSHEYDIRKAFVLCNGNIRMDGKIIYLPIYMTMFIRKTNDNAGIYEIDLSGLI